MARKKRKLKESEPATITSTQNISPSQEQVKKSRSNVASQEQIKKSRSNVVSSSFISSKVRNASSTKSITKSLSNIPQSKSETVTSPSESLSSDSDRSEREIPFPVSAPKDGKEKKGKKEKDKKKKKKKAKEVKIEEELVEEEPEGPPEDDFSATLSFMDRVRLVKIAEREAAENEEPVVEEPPMKKKKKKKKKKGPKKKLSKKEKARLAADLLEKQQKAAEEEAARQAELERIRLLEERKAAIEKEKRETFEQQIRMEMLETSYNFLQELIAYNKNLRETMREQQDWEFYVNCERLPSPAKCDQLTTFLHLWENEIEETTVEEAARRTVDMLHLLNDLDNLIDTADKDNYHLVENWNWVRLLFREKQAKSLDVASYRLLRDIEKNLNRINIPTADYKYRDDNIALCLWLRVQLPTPLPNPRRPPKPRIEVEFPEMKMEVQFPVVVDGEKMAIRALYVKYDHLSDLSDTYQKPAVPLEYDIDLYDAMRKEWRDKLLYKYDNRVRKVPTPPKEGDSEGEVPEEPREPEVEDFGPDDEIPVVPYRKLEPTASEFVITKEDQLYTTTRAGLIKQIPDKEVINLRKYSIIGGVYALNLLYQPPQPQDFVTMEMTLTPLYLPKELEFVEFYVDYTSFSADAITKMTPEEIEEAMKKHEEDLDRLIQITITWPEHVIFLELPMVCYWDPSAKVWTKEDVHDLKHNEEKGQLTFRTVRCGTFALAAYRYANLPYQAWELRPETDGSVSLQITAAILMVEFNVRDGEVALSQLQNSPNNALQDAVGGHLPLPRLIRRMQEAGVDVFPAFDAFCHVENACEKHWPMEKHLYFNMAQLSACFNFASSRWNVPAGRRGVVVQMREYNLEKSKQRSHSMLHVTPSGATFVDCTEVSPTFSEEPLESMKVRLRGGGLEVAVVCICSLMFQFCPDLFGLVKATSNMAVKNRVKVMSKKEVVYGVYELLVATRVVSFS